jgi:hypothetical protein
VTLQITLPHDLEGRLRMQAERLQLAPEALTIKLLDEHLPQASRDLVAVSLLQQWSKEDEEISQDEIGSNAAVLRALDEDRLSDRKLFPNLQHESE